MKINRKMIIALTLVVVLAATSVLILFNRGGDEFIALPPVSPEARAAEHVFDTQGGLLETGHRVTPLSIQEALARQEAREGYTLAPTVMNAMGIDPVSSFVLETPGGYEESLPQITMDGHPDPTINRYDSNIFVIAPSIPLTSNTVVVFRLVTHVEQETTGDEQEATHEEQEVTWAFQIAPQFEITSTLPAHQATNVPVRTGIEVTFSAGEAIDISDHFSIYPQVEGQFIYRDSTAIFMPTNPLSEGQVYTVIIRQGLTLPNISDVISTDYMFSFETASDARVGREGSSNIHFFNPMVEFPSFAEASVSYWLNYDRDLGRPSIEMNIYRIDDLAQGIAAANQLVSTPYWSAIWGGQRIVDTSDFTRVSSTTVNQRQGTSEWDETFTFPEVLPPGFYLLDAVLEDGHGQVIIQITDLAIQLLADDNKALLWINDMTTGQPVAGANVLDPVSRSTGTSSEYGIAVIEGMVAMGEYLVITTPEGKESVIFASGFGVQPFGGRSWGAWDHWGWGMGSANRDYWTALQLDRTLFQRSDTLSFWGFVQNRHREEEISHVTAVLRSQVWWDFSARDTLYRENIGVENGAYWGEIHLPHLDPGSYELTIYHGDIPLSSTFFTVMDYVTPPYRLTVSASHNAVFAGEEVTFTARTEFFEGTSVPDLEVSYSVSSWELIPQTSGSRPTNQEGVIEVVATPQAENARVQGERTLDFFAEATLPEMGWTHQGTSVRVFVNDIHMNAMAIRDEEGEGATLSLDIHQITLDRLNAGTQESWNDFLDAPVENQQVSVEIIEIYWEAIRDGERYDHVTRQVIPRYRYERRETRVDQFQVTTDRDGHATTEFTLPGRERASYQARLTTTDGNGRQMIQEVFFGRDFFWFFWNAGEDEMFLDGVNEEGYRIGDAVELTLMQGTEVVEGGNFLFVMVKDNIISYHMGSNPLAFTFEERHVPNVRVYAYHFNGHTYHSGWQMNQRLRFHDPDRELVIEVSTCEESYRPGETVEINVVTTDNEGNPKAAHVNVSLVNEALLALMENHVDTFEMLYRSVDDHLRISTTSHRTFVSDGLWNEARVAAAGDDMAMAVEEEAADGAGFYGGPVGGHETRIRQRFEDTAIFMSLQTDDRGRATFTFELPDNITSWRVTASGITNDLYAGNGACNIPVTLPMFLHYTLNNTFLVGDVPYIGVNAYGTSLAPGEQVLFEVWREEAPQDVRTATGDAFERVNIPLWEKTQEGFGALIVHASVAGYQDAVQHAYQVIGSHRQVETARFYQVTEETAFEVPSDGLTNITFMDAGRGQFLDDLISMRFIWRNGARIEGLVAKREATRLIEMHFPETALFREPAAFDVSDYQMEDGGIAILPYGSSDLLTTVSLLPFVAEEVNRVALRDYLQNIANTSTTENRILALYGLAILGEPVLLDLRNYAQLEGLSVRDTAFLALALVEIGERHVARELYNEVMAPLLEEVAPYVRVNTGGSREEMLEDTSVVALLAARLGEPEATRLHDYSMRHRRFEPLMNIERVAFISYEINYHTAQEASVTYILFGETITRELGHGGRFNLRIPVTQMNEFELVGVTGEVGAVSIVRVPLEEMETIENNITIRRRFFIAGSNIETTTFEQGDVVRVEINIDYSAGALSGSYMITDFLPAGLVYVPHSARFGDVATTPGWWTHVQAEGQRITFFDFNGRFHRNNTYYFYARVVNPGTFRAEGTIVQSVDAREYMVVGESVVVTINP